MALDINIVVLGGCGFLGQHVVAELLTEKERLAKEPGKGTEEEKKQWSIQGIKVLDVKAYNEDFLTGQRQDASSVTYEECDITDFGDLKEKLKGASVVVNCAVVSPNFLKEDLGCGEHMRRVNVDGTKLRTIALRPPIIYGEGDTSFVPLIYTLAKAAGNKLPSIGHPGAFTQAAYAGNVAVAYIGAINHLLTDEGRSELHTCNGLPVYITDDTPPNNLVDLASPFLEHANLEPSSKDSYWAISLSLYWADLVYGIKTRMGLTTGGQGQALPIRVLHQFAGTISVVSRMRAELCLGYTPAYSWEQAMKRSNLYYSRYLN